ncbi:MAG: cytochrome C, partial [Octadecabacter sp.]
MKRVNFKSFTFLLASFLLLVFIAGSHEVLSQDADADPDVGDDVLPFAVPPSGPFNAAEIKIETHDASTDWFRSGHADAASEAFSHWDEDEEIRPACASCHSGEGFRAFHGLDGSEPGIVEGPIDVGGVVEWGPCHNSGLAEISEVQF